MEKVIYALWKDEADSTESFNEKLLSDISAKLKIHAHSVRINIQDAVVANGTSPKVFATTPHIQAVIQVWIDSANDAFRRPIDNIIDAACLRFEAWLVSDSTPIPNTKYISQLGERTEGFSQVVFLGRPDHLSWAKWRKQWHNVHTRVAIDTQSNFEYIQNLVTRRLTPEAPKFAAIVEECFPIDALTDQYIYFDAIGDEAKLQSNQKLMTDSVVKFIDYSKMDCIPTSQYDFKRLLN